MAQKFFEIVPNGTKIDFIGKWRLVFAGSVLMIVASIFFLSTKGLNYGVDFKGGTDIHVHFFDRLEVGEVRSILGTVGFQGAMVQGYGDKGSGEFLIRLEPEKMNIEKYKNELQAAFDKASPKGGGKARIRFQEDRIYVSFDKPSDPKTLKSAVDGLKLRDLRVDTVTPFGRSSGNEYLVQFAGVATKVLQAFRGELGPGKLEVLAVDQVGAKVGAELRMQAIGAILIAILLIGVYVWFRFDLMFAPGAMISLIHDPLAVFLVFSAFGLQLDLTIVAAFLTMIGFSINDTIVVYDRIRENVKKSKDASLPAIMNKSINETLGRTVLTSGTLMIAAIALLLWGGPITFNFALALGIGSIVGTYSSIYVCCPITIMVHNYMIRRSSSR